VYEKRTYRQEFCKRCNDLVGFEVCYYESDLFILMQVPLYKEAYNSLVTHHSIIRNYIDIDPKFGNTFWAYSVPTSAPKIIREMSEASVKTGVGPMAAVAGAISEAVGSDLSKYSEDVIIENGGDIFVSTTKPRTIGILAGASKLSGKLAIELPAGKWGVCTSAGTVGHSVSMGKADACVVVGMPVALADAAATKIGNIIQHEKDIPEGLECAKVIDGVKGVVIIKNSQIGVCGNIKLLKI
jgi:hypothetical protein